jgi:hypothetical protein
MQVLEAFAAWLRLSGAAGMDGAQLAAHPLTQASGRFALCFFFLNFSFLPSFSVPMLVAPSVSNLNC